MRLTGVPRSPLGPRAEPRPARAFSNKIRTKWMHRESTRRRSRSFSHTRRAPHQLELGERSSTQLRSGLDSLRTVRTAAHTCNSRPSLPSESPSEAAARSAKRRRCPPTPPPIGDHIPCRPCRAVPSIPFDALPTSDHAYYVIRK